ncbi:MAG: SoxR reducing system RseC family protein [Desulfohalobiaceae bacterium]|nr:SoxR reducing system RseC family protein [Desulfohalobiaceae bacterium]
MRKVPFPDYSSCDPRDVCKPLGRGHMAMEVYNGLGARPGQIVQVSSIPKKTFKIFLIHCLPPLAAFLVGAVS